jgi:hypothetical protein
LRPMARKPPRKPTDEFGVVQASAQGGMQKIVETLPAVKEAQEGEIGRRFAEALSERTSSKWTARPLPEDGHDFLLVGPDGEIEVQAVEIAAKRDFLARIAIEDWKESRHGFDSVAVLGPDEIWGIDAEKQRAVIWEKIALKLSKNYSKPKRVFWLLVWTTYQGFHTIWVENGVARTSRNILFARKKLRSLLNVVFDEIWFWSPASSGAVNVWPSDELPEEASADAPIKRRDDGQVGMFIPATMVQIVSPKK